MRYYATKCECLRIKRFLEDVYRFDCVAIEFVDRSETKLFRCKTSCGVYAVKVYEPDSEVDFSVYGENRYLPANLENIMQLLRKLKEADSADGFAIPIPVKTSRYVATMDGRAVTVSSWITGQDLAHARHDNQIIYVIGRKLAEFHERAKQIVDGDGIRLQPGASVMIDQWRSRIHDTTLSKEIRDKILMACDMINQAEIGIGGKMIVAHGDFSLSNIVVGPAYALIDFSLCSISHPYLDLGSLAFELPETEVKSLIAGYADRTGLEIDYKLVMIYRLFRTMLYAVANISHIGDWSWMQGNPLVWTNNLWLCENE